MINWNNLDTLDTFKELAKVAEVDLVEVMSGENGAERVKNYSVPMAEGLTYNYAAKKVDETTLAALVKLAEEAQLSEKFEALYNGAVINTGENRLQNRCRLRTENIDQCDQKGNQNSYCDPGCIDIKARNRIHITLQKSRPQIGNDGWKCARLKTGNADISKNNCPGTDKGSIRSHCLIAEYVLAAALRHCCGQLCVGQADEENHDTTDGKCDCRSDNATFLNPVSRGYNPAPANHGSEGNDQNIPCA